VLLASDGQEAIDLLASGSAVEAVVTDLLMAQVDAHAFMAYLDAERPELARRVVFVSAALEDARYEDLLARVRPALAKPAAAEALIAAVDALL
jgi:DNA-binding NarL/FixJ family response regulator